jgi:tetratricopeptide (TPR) repeat protein
VAWITERKNMLSGMFWLLTMIAYLRYTERPGVARYALLIVCFALGLMAKPVLVTLPCALLLIDYWPLCRLPFSPVRNTPDNRVAWQVAAVSLRRAVLEKLPLLVLSCGSGAVTLLAHEELGTTISLSEVTPSFRLQNAIVSYARYLLKTVWPSHLCVYYPMPEAWAGWQVAGGLAIIGGITITGFVYRKQMPYLAVGWLWFLGVLAPTIGIVQASTQAMADRFAYLPLIGLFIAIIWGAADCLQRWKLSLATAITLASAILLACAATTWQQLRHWQNSVTLFSHALAVTKNNPVAHNNLGAALEQLGRREEALPHYREAIRLKPQSPQAYNNLGNVLDALGRFDEALAAYHEALRLRPGVALVHNNLGMMLAKQGKYEDARTNFLQAMALQPKDAQAYYLMGILHLQMNELRAARDGFQTALDRDPNHLKALVYLARLLAASEDNSLRQASRAVLYAERAATLTGFEQPAVLDILAMAYAEAGRFNDAAKMQQAALELFKPAQDAAAIAAARQRLALYQAGKPFRESAPNLYANPFMNQ